ncbi:MAG TPA: NADP-dependent methylenetetrahydromethanopterin/methylenetetrahydrofolate dehydrogenase [Gammaproteobacteria bacterium]|nr:NADP-dependent methylenetetrahydromethanopterin/methylenetetrahydrofolate dehydrogenase [Gammaproteobacteria bacterium]
MKKLLYQLDTDAHPAVFDSVVGYDGGADHVIGYGNCNEGNVTSLVEGTIFTRAPKDKKNTAIFVGGSNMTAGEHLFAAIQKVFFADFRVSVMLDSNGSNTTAAAAVAKMLTSGSMSGKKAVILAGTGPVGRRAAVMMSREGAHVSITSRKQSNAEEACKDIKDQFDVDIEPIGAPSNDDRARAIEEANIVFCTGAAGIQLLDESSWADNKNIEILADANATPPLGIGGTDMMDRGKERNGKITWGAIGFGTLKLAVHRACIAKLFESNDVVLDAEEIFALPKSMA